MKEDRVRAWQETAGEHNSPSCVCTGRPASSLPTLTPLVQAIEDFILRRRCMNYLAKSLSIQLPNPIGCIVVSGYSAPYPLLSSSKIQIRSEDGGRSVGTR